MPTTLTNGIQLPDKGSVDWYSSMQSNYNLIDTHLGDTDTHVTAEDKANWNSKQGSLSQAQLDAIAQVSTNTSDIATLQSGKANASHTHSSSDITDIGDYATKQYVDNSISGLVDNAPDALNTLNELSAALNDDSNFASTVTTALAAKANSADLATVATSGSYTDLTDKPTIPTNTSDLTNDSDFVVSSNLATVATSGDYDDLSNKPSIPTNTSDLTNDSNFVDTSNSAVSSGITSAKVTDYDAHIEDTDIHVTTADKNKWNNNTYVLRYSSTTLVASSTNSNSLLDNTDNLKVGDKVLDSSGNIYVVTAIDTTNSTFTIGTSLIDLAQDSDVVHKSGDEYITDTKTFGNGTLIVNNGIGNNVHGEIKLYGSRSGYIVADNAADGIFDNANCGISILLQDAGKPLHVGAYKTDSNGRVFADNTNKNQVLTVLGSLVKTTTLIPENDTANSTFRILSQLDYANGDPSKVLDVRFQQKDDASSVIYSNDDSKTALGAPTKRWRGVYATNYYYGNDNVEFSTKFVTTDTAQTISGNKTFSDGIGLNSWLYFTNTSVTKGTIPQSTTNPYRIYFGSGVNYANSLFNIDTSVSNTGAQALTLRSAENVVNGDDTRFVIAYDPNLTQPKYASLTGDFIPRTNNTYGCGTNNNKWKSFNGVEPSLLSLPSQTYVDISSYFTNTGTGDTNSYVASANGWIYLRLADISACHATVYDSNNNRMWGQSTSGSVEQITIPILKGQTLMTRWNTSSTVIVAIARFIPCQGNV